MLRYRVHSLVQSLAGLSCLMILASCASLNRPPKLVIDGLIFQNRSGATVHDIQVHVKKTSAFANCSPVLSDSECTTTFKPFQYKGNMMTVSWNESSSKRNTEEFHAELPSLVSAEKTAKLLVVINSAGTATAMLVQ